MTTIKNFFATRWGIISVGAFIGVFAPLLQKWGNPANMALSGALVFLGCPWRAMLRFAGGDGNAIFGLLGLIGGIWIGTLFLRSGYNLGRSQTTHTSVGWLLPLIMIGFLVLMFIFPQMEGQEKSGILFYSVKGPGSMYAPLFVSLLIGLCIGFLAQR